MRNDKCGCIVCFDLGRHTGIFIGPVDGEVTPNNSKIQTLHLGESGQSHGAMFASFYNGAEKALREALKIGNVDSIVFEEPHFVGGAATRLLLGYRAILHMLADQWDMPIEGVHTGTLKKTVSGKGKATKREMREAIRRTYQISSVYDIGTLTSDDIDAVALWLWWRKEKENASTR